MPRRKTYQLAQHERPAGRHFLEHRHGSLRTDHHDALAQLHTDAEAIAWAGEQIRTSPHNHGPDDVWQLVESFKTRAKQSRPVGQWEADILALVRRAGSGRRHLRLRLRRLRRYGGRDRVCRNRPEGRHRGP